MNVCAVNPSNTAMFLLYASQILVVTNVFFGHLVEYVVEKGKSAA